MLIFEEMILLMKKLTSLLAALCPEDPQTVAEAIARDWQEIALSVCGE